MSDYLENKVLDGTVGNVSYTAPSTIYMALYSVAPSDSSSGTELSGNGYSRQSVAFGTAAASGSISNTADVTFTASGGDWTVAGAALVDASSSGNILYWSTQNRSVPDGDSLVYATGKISIFID